MNKMSFKIDYLNGILPITRVDSLFESLKNIDEKFDLSNWVKNPFAVRGIRNYNCRFHFMGENNFIVAWNCNDFDYPYIAKSPLESKYNPYIYITISSQGLNYFDSESFMRFCKYLYRCEFKASRLDSACDIYNKDNDIVPLLLQSFHFTSGMRNDKGVNFVSSNMSLEPKFSKKANKVVRPVTYYANYYADGNITENVVFGHHGSDLGMFRMYDKFFEQGLDTNKFVDYSDKLVQLYNKLYPDKYRYRLEVELHHKHAEKLFNVFVSENLEYYDLFASALVSMFVVKSSKGCGYLAGQCDISPVWSCFLSELSNSIHFVELDRNETVPVVQLPIEELKEKFLHYAPLLCAYEDLCELDIDFRSRITVGERYRYDNKYQYQYLRQLLFKSRERQKNCIVV